MAAEDYENLLQLVGHAYELALDPDGWSGFASIPARTFDAGSAAVQFRDTRNKRLVSPIIYLTKLGPQGTIGLKEITP